MNSEYQYRETPVHRSLNQEKTMAGGEKALVATNFTLAACISFGSSSLYWIPVALLIHFFLVWLHKLDPKMRKIYFRYSKQHTRYDPWPHAIETRNSRPEGFDKGNLC